MNLSENTLVCQQEKLSSRNLAMQYPARGSMPQAVVHQLYLLREAEVEALSRCAVVNADDLHDLDRGARAAVATMLYEKCDDAARRALLHDEHPHVRSCAAISQSELQIASRLPVHVGLKITIDGSDKTDWVQLNANGQDTGARGWSWNAGHPGEQENWIPLGDHNRAAA